MKAAHFRIVGLLDEARPSVATVTVDRAAGLFSVRPLRRRRIYTLPLATVAEIIVQRMIRLETLERARAKREARKGRRR